MITILLCRVSLFIEAKITLTLNFLTAESFEVTAADLYHGTQFSYFVVYQRGHPVALKKYILLLFHWGTFVILGTGISKHDCLPHESRELLAGFKWSNLISRTIMVAFQSNKCNTLFLIQQQRIVCIYEETNIS